MPCRFWTKRSEHDSLAARVLKIERERERDPAKITNEAHRVCNQPMNNPKPGQTVVFLDRRERRISATLKMLREDVNALKQTRWTADSSPEESGGSQQSQRREDTASHYQENERSEEVLPELPFIFTEPARGGSGRTALDPRGLHQYSSEESAPGTSRQSHVQFAGPSKPFSTDQYHCKDASSATFRGRFRNQSYPRKRSCID